MPDIVIAPEDDAQVVADFVNQVWSSHYPDDTQLVIWPKEFFEWQFQHGLPDQPATMLGVRLEGVLVGVACVDIWMLHSSAKPLLTVSYCSCFSVANVPTRGRVAISLLKATRAWAQERGATTLCGFVNPANSSQSGRSFWTTRRDHKAVFPKAGARQWHLTLPKDPSEKAAPSNSVAAMDEDILESMLHSFEQRSKTPSVRTIYWSPDRLQRQMSPKGLGGSFFQRDGTDYAACNFYVLETRSGRKTSFIDFFDATPNRADLASAVYSKVAAELTAQGCTRAFTLGAPSNDETLLKTVGFRPLFPSYSPLLASWQAPHQVHEDETFALFFR